jgi:hypothetical protein
MTRLKSKHARPVLALAVLAAGFLSGCGKQGALERPAPLFGSRARAEYEAERAQEARDDAQRRGQTTGQQPAAANENSRREQLDPNRRLEPASVSPVPGAPTPMGAPASVSPTR